jgi:hypothetical protein
MDPWLEQPSLWPDAHNSLIVAIRDAIVPMVDPRYFVGLETRTTVLTWPERESQRVIRPDISIRRGDPGAGSPTALSSSSATAVLEEVRVEPVVLELPEMDEVEEWYLEIRSLPDQAVVTVIELLSPTDKTPGEGRGQYLVKRAAVLQSLTNLVEIDLLRSGLPVPMREPMPPADYRILVSRGRSRPKADLYRGSIRRPLPAFPIPLLPGEDEPILDINTVLHGLMDRARFFRVIDYASPPDPPLLSEDEAWVRSILDDISSNEPNANPAEIKP